MDRYFRLVATALWLLFTAPAMAESAMAPSWSAIPLVTPASRDRGHIGGEGGQAIRTLVISQSEPTFLMMGTDVGGIYRSLDSGDHWQICMSSWSARGGNAFAIDPTNPDRVLGVGANGSDFGPPSNGIYLSTDRGASWKQVLPRNDGNEWRRDSIAFDPTSRDDKLPGCSVAYFESRDGGLFKSTDGGVTWACVNKDRAGAAMKIHPNRGFVYLADNSQHNHGFYKSIDGGATFRRINDNYTLGLDVIPTQPNSVYIARWDKILVSTDSGETFKPVGRNEGLPSDRPMQDIRVSPADPKIMAAKHGGSQWWESYTFYSDNGGDTWHKPTYDNSLAFLPFTQPDEKCAFHPTDPRTVFSTAGGGWVVKSTDGGKTYSWHNDGQNAIMLGATFNFSVAHPDCIFLAFQDFAGAITLDGGKCWTFRNPSTNGWGGFDYGGYTVDGRTLWCGDAPSWTGPRTLKLSRDSGQSWSVVNDTAGKPIIFAGSHVSFSDPALANVYFASNYRSGDGGKTWSAMPKCDGVFIASPDGKSLYGSYGSSVCKSVDHGESWVDVSKPVSGGIRDVAVDEARGRIYAASEDRLKLFDHDAWTALETPKDQYGQSHVYSVATDPQDPAVVYAGGPANLYSSSATIFRSTDAGKSWTNLTVNEPLKSFPNVTGPREVQWVRVHPRTHDAWVNGECYGMWRFTSHPDAAMTTIPVSAPRPAAIPAAIPAPTTSRPATKPSGIVIRNGGMTQGLSIPAEWNGKYGECEIVRDTQIFKGAPASLRVSVSGGKSGQAFQTITAKPGAEFSLTGWLKSTGDVKVNVAVQSFDNKFTKNDFQQIKYTTGENDWTEFEKKVTIPPWASQFHVLLLVEGNGQAWLDEVHDSSAAIDPGEVVDPLVSEAAPKGKPSEPGWGFYPQFPKAWQAAHQSLLARAKEGKIDLVFIGDSITQGWNDTGKKVWDAHFANYHPADFGIGGDSTRQVLWRINHGELEGLSPKVAVVLIGTNNLYSDTNAGTDDEVAAGIEAVTKALRAKLPNTKILLLAIFPRQNDFFCSRIDKINAMTSRWDDRSAIRYLNLKDSFLASPGKVKAELFQPDQLHLNAQGYEVWANQMKPLLDEMMRQ